jgi:dTDP-4-dehydrorhamnose 3,5-epimerase
VIFTETPVAGAFVIDLEPREDERGSFARTFDAEEFRAHALEHRVVQSSVSVNVRAGTLRGLHYQTAPHGETKLVRCARGAIFDVIVDLREASPAYLRWFSVELSPESGRMLYVPEQVAHGFQTLVDDTEVHYQMGREYVPSHSTGVRWDDPLLGVDWPEAERTISPRDASYPDIDPSGRAGRRWLSSG